MKKGKSRTRVLIFCLLWYVWLNYAYNKRLLYEKEDFVFGVNARGFVYGVAGSSTE